MKIKKYKLGNFTISINSQAYFNDELPYSLFEFNGEQTDYNINVKFSSELPKEIKNPFYASRDRVYDYKDGVLRCFYKSSDTEDEYYAYRIVDGKNIIIVINEEYREMLREDVIFSLIGIEEIAAGENACILHSSFIEYNGGAVLFTGPCSIGKSTQANLWNKYANAIVINGDKTMIYKNNGLYCASGIPFSGSSKDCLNKVLPLKAIINLGQADFNSLNRVVSTDAFYKVYKNCYPIPFSRELTGMLFDLVQELSQCVPVYNFACLADESAVRCLESELCQIFQSH